MNQSLRRVINWFSASEPPPSQFRQAATFESSRVVEQIEGLAKERQGWNTYRAGPVPYQARARAIRFVEAMERQLALAGVRIIAPSVTLTPNSGVGLRWETPDREVLVIIQADGGEFSVADMESDELVAQGPLGSLDPIKDIVPHVGR